MTFRVNFYSEHIFLSVVKKALVSDCTDREQEIELGAICVLSCAAALEAVVNTLLKENGKLSHFDGLKLSSKIDTIAEFADKKVNWGSIPWQLVTELIRIRNWLAHYKDPDIGLINSDGDWIKDDINKLPKIDPDIVLELSYVKKFYLGVREALITLVEWTDTEPYLYEYLKTEEYEAFLVG